MGVRNRRLAGSFIAGIVVAVLIAFAGWLFWLPIPQPSKITMPGNRWALLYRLQEGPGPTIILLHPYTGDAPSVGKYSGFLQAAAPHRLNLVVPEAIGKEWHDSPEAKAAYGNDIEFIAALIEKLIADKIADPQRIFVSGNSNGGMMAFTMVCVRPDLFAAIGTISASMPKQAFETCPLPRPMPLFMINGDADNVLPYRGGDIGVPTGMFFRNIAGVDETAALFAQANGCIGACQPKDTSLSDGGRKIERYDWNVPPNAAVTVVRVVGGAHDVIGWRSPLQAFLGLPPRGIATAASIVERFVDLDAQIEARPHE